MNNMVLGDTIDGSSIVYRKKELFLEKGLAFEDASNLFFPIKPKIESIKKGLKDGLKESISGEFKQNKNWYWFTIKPQNQAPRYSANLMKKFIELTKDDILKAINESK